MPRVWIYRPAKTAMQSAYANTRHWIMEFEPGAPSEPEPLMGWISSADTNTQVHLHFDTEEEAIAYAKRQGYEFTLSDSKPRKIRPKSYADNFRYNRVLW